MEADQSGRLELPLRAQRYIDVVQEVEVLEKLAAENPADIDKYDEAIERGRIKLSILEPDAAEAFVRVAETVEPLEVAHRRNIIESLRDDDDYGTALTEDDIQSQLAALPSFRDYSPETRSFVADYFRQIGEWAAATSVLPPEDIPPVAEPESEVVKITPRKPEAPFVAPMTSENGEAKTEKTPLTITIFRDHAIQIGENGEVVSMLRSMDVPKTSAEEIAIARARINALQVITAYEAEEQSTERAQRGLDSAAVWQAYATTTDGEYNSTFHSDEIADFLNGLSYDGEPIVDIYKPTETAKRRYHRNAGFDVTFVESDERSGLDRRDIFELPNGEILFGKTAKFAHMLIRASEAEPVTLDDLRNSDVYTLEDKEKLGDNLSLSSMASYLRKVLADRQLDALFSIQSFKNPDRSMVYWLEYHGADAADLYPFMAVPSPDTMVELDPADRPQREGMAETEDEREASMHQCAHIAKWLASNNARLAAHGLPNFDETTAEALSSAAAQPMHPVKLRMLLTEISKLSRVPSFMEYIAEKIPSGDPRWPVIDYLVAPGKAEGDLTVHSLVKEFAELDESVDESLVELYETIYTWLTLDEQERLKLAEGSFDLFDRIGNDISDRLFVDGVSWTSIFSEVQNRLVEYANAKFEIAVSQAFANAYNRWAEKSSQRPRREKRRDWGRNVKFALNHAFNN